MKSCCKCGKRIISGHIICSNCVSNDDLPLEYYIDQLAEKIVLKHPEAMCSLCIWGGCGQQQSGLTCRKNVKEYLLLKKKEFTALSELKPDECKEQFDFLDSLFSSNVTSVSEMRKNLAATYLHMTAYQLDVIFTAWADSRLFDLKKGK